MVIQKQVILRLVPKLRQSLLATAVLLSIAMVGLGGSASAHKLRQANGSISGVLHIPLQDQPRAGEPSKLALSFGDSKNQFNLGNCMCTLTIKKYGKVVHTSAIVPQTPGATFTSINDYEFPSVATYDIIVHGKAKAGQFHEFNLLYDVEVQSDVRETANVGNKQDASAIAILGFGILAGIAVFAVAGARDSGRYRAALVEKPVVRKKSTGKK